ncbi:uncharacterized protein LOC141889078 isoform X2 [Acropora palmata]|uniref:uncharacterized protein LOC141889078 isoform X2 n=1 Tax=Acropora palmata TaxID=6131 RepID=UPI003DA0D177
MYSNILWQKISSAVLALGSGCGDVISRLKTECMDPAAEADYQQLLSDWKKDDDVVKEMLERTQDTLGEIEENQERTNIKLGEVKGYHGEIKPDQAKECDLRACNISTQDKDWTLLHGCFHFFHNECLNGSTSCPLCKDFLKEKVKDLGGGLSGSNACTVTAVLAGQHYLEETLPIPKPLQDLNRVIPLYIVLMMKGNQIHQSFQLPAQQPNLEVDIRQVLQQHNNEQFQDLEIIEDLGFFSVQDLQDHRTQHHHQHPRFAAVLIVPPDKSMVLCFDHTTINLFESHRHGLQGGLIATSSFGNINNFIRYLAGMVMHDWGAQLQESNMAILGLK